MSRSMRPRRHAASANAFRDSFLDRLLVREEADAGEGEDPERAGDWQVHEIAGRFVLLREWERPGTDTEACWFYAQEHALIAVAALAAASRGPMFSYGPPTAAGTFPIVLSEGGERTVIGENRLFDSDFIGSLHALEMSRRRPRALAYLLQGASGPAIAMAGRILERRIGRGSAPSKRPATVGVESDAAPDSEIP